jgi:hypothetical protein
MTARRWWLTVEEVAERTGLTRDAVRYHCRDPRGAFYDKAVRSDGPSRPWRIPRGIALKFIGKYETAGSPRAGDPAERPDERTHP